MKDFIVLDKPNRTISVEPVNIESDYTYISDGQVVETPKERGTE